MNHRYTLVIVSLLFCISCKNPSSNDDTIVATETWRITIPQTDNHADIVMKKGSSGTIICTGNWYFDFFGNMITCAIMTGTVTKNGSAYTFTCSGTAAYPPDEDGYVESSAFSLQMNGEFSGGSGSGGWDISFTDEEWDEWAPDPGQYTATRTDGSGVTE